MARQDVTKLLANTLREFAEFKSEDVRDSVVSLIDALDADLEAIEYGQSDEVNDKMALLFAANGDAREELDEDEKPAIKDEKVKEDEDEPADLDDEDEEDDSADKELAGDDEEDEVK